VDLANRVVAGARHRRPFSNIGCRSTSDILDVNIAGGVVVARLVAAVIDGSVGSALGGCDGVLKRVAAKIV